MSVVEKLPAGIHYAERHIERRPLVANKVGSQSPLFWLTKAFEYNVKCVWPAPGGMAFDSFFSKLLLCVVPRGWVKYGKDIGKGHVAFLNLILSNGTEIDGQRWKADEALVNSYFESALSALRDSDVHYFGDLAAAASDWFGNQAILTPTNNIEYRVLVAMLYEPRDRYTPCELRALVKDLFAMPHTDADLLHQIRKVAKRFGIRRS